MSSKSTVVTSVLAALLVAVLGSDGDRAFRVANPSDEAARETVTKLELQPVGHGVEVRSLVDVGPVLIDPDTGELVRWVKVNSHCALSAVGLEDAYLSRKVPAESAVVVSSRVGPVNTGIAHFFAASCLGQVDAAGNMLVTPAEEPVQVAEQVVAVAPVAGLTWGAVTTSSDLIVTTEPLR